MWRLLRQDACATDEGAGVLVRRWFAGPQVVLLDALTDEGHQLLTNKGTSTVACPPQLMFTPTGLRESAPSCMPRFTGVAYGKLQVNLFNAVNALSGVSLSTMLASRGYRAVARVCIEEALQVYQGAFSLSMFFSGCKRV
jgi:hypothetical protein